MQDSRRRCGMNWRRMTWTPGFCLQLRWRTLSHRIRYWTFSAVKVRKKKNVSVHCDVCPQACMYVSGPLLNAAVSVPLESREISKRDWADFLCLFWCTFIESSVQGTRDADSHGGGSPRRKRRRLFNGTGQAPSNSIDAPFQEILAPFKVRSYNFVSFLLLLGIASGVPADLLLDRRPWAHWSWRCHFSNRSSSSLASSSPSLSVRLWCRFSIPILKAAIQPFPSLISALHRLSLSLACLLSGADWCGFSGLRGRGAWKFNLIAINLVQRWSHHPADETLDIMVYMLCDGEAEDVGMGFN